MYLQGFGEILADVMTVNPALSELPSASSILDASNYTFQAITFGKDADVSYLYLIMDLTSQMEHLLTLFPQLTLISHPLTTQFLMILSRQILGWREVALYP